MSAPRPEAGNRDQYLAEANAELDAMLGEVGEIDAQPSPSRTLVQLVVVAVIAVAVLALGMLLLRGRRPRRMAMHVMR